MKTRRLTNPHCQSCAQESEAPRTGEEPGAGFRRQLLLIACSALFFAAGLLAGKLRFAGRLPAWEFALLLAAYAVSGWRVVLGALRDALRGRFFDERFLMTVATLGALLIGELAEAVGVMLFFQVGSLLEDLALHRSRKSIKALLALRPDSAGIKAGGEVRRVPAAEVKVGEVMVVKPGERISLDGIVLSGMSQVDSSALTGESRPRPVAVGDAVMAGMINQGQLLEIEVKKTLSASSLSKILTLVEKAAARKARPERFITRFARYYSPLVVAAAAAVALLPPLLLPGEAFDKWLYRALVMLVISCPCALVISIPLGYFGGLGLASRRGILVKGSQSLDALAAVRTVVFDKTGTLTRGVFKVTEVVPADGTGRKELLRLAGEAESQSTHPIAQSIAEAWGRKMDPEQIQEYREIGGQGIKARIRGRTVIAGSDPLLHREGIEHPRCDVPGTVVHLAQDGRYLGYLVVSDELKQDARAAVYSLRRQGIDTIVMLTGDNKHAAGATAGELDLDAFHADLMPEDKLERLDQIMAAQGRGVAFVGDGINDAPVLARADVGLAMGKLGSDAAIETADVVLMSDSPAKVGEAVRLARRTRSIVWQNILLALSVKALLLALGVLGLATLWAAVFGDIGVALLAILNSIRTVRA